MTDDGRLTTACPPERNARRRKDGSQRPEAGGRRTDDGGRMTDDGRRPVRRSAMRESGRTEAFGETVKQ